MGNPNRFNQFRAEIATNRLAPATSNLWEFRLPPPVFMASQFGRFNSDVRETVSNINYFANSVTVPSRAVTTGEVNNFGSITSTSAGVGTGFDVDITSAHTIENLDSGGAGSVTTGQFVTSVTTK